MKDFDHQWLQSALVCSFLIKPTYIVTLTFYRETCCCARIKKCLGHHCHKLITWLAPRNVMLDLKIGWDHFHYMMHQSPASWSLLKLDMFISRLFWLWIGNKCGMCYMWTTFLWTFTNNMTWFSTIQTKIIFMLTLFFLIHEGLESCFINLHLVSSFGEVAKG
jgi:hypothetical protein